MTNKGALNGLKESMRIFHEKCNFEVTATERKAWEMIEDVVENCPPKEAICYGCHENCKKCEIMGMAMI